MILKIHLTPKAKENRIVGFEDNILKVRVTAPPVGGRANEALIKLLSKEYKVAKSEIQIVRGQKSREKEVIISK